MATIIKGNDNFDTSNNASQTELDLKANISGSVLQVVSHLTAIQGTQTITVVDTQVNDLVKSIIPRGNNSKFLVTVRWFGECEAAYDICFNIQMNGTRVNINGGGRGYGLVIPSQSYGVGLNDASTPETVNMQTLVNTSSVIGTAIEFKVVADGNTNRILWNNRCFDALDTNFERGTSEIIITEIGA